MSEGHTFGGGGKGEGGGGAAGECAEAQGAALGRAGAEAFTALVLEPLYCGTSRIITSFAAFVEFDGTRGR